MQDKSLLIRNTASVDEFLQQFQNLPAIQLFFLQIIFSEEG
jgi:glutathione peroxidase-family protein